MKMNRNKEQGVLQRGSMAIILSQEKLSWTESSHSSIHVVVKTPNPCLSSLSTYVGVSIRGDSAQSSQGLVKKTKPGL